MAEYREGLGVTTASPPAPEAGVAENLLDEIRGRIWSNTGCSDSASEDAAAAVYDLFLDQPNADLRALLSAAKRVLVAYDEVNAWMALGWPARTLVAEPNRNAARASFDALRAAVARIEGAQ